MRKAGRKFEAEGHEAAKEGRKKQKGRAALNHPQPKLRLPKLQEDLRIKDQTLQPPTGMQSPQSRHILACEDSAIITVRGV